MMASSLERQKIACMTQPSHSGRDRTFGDVPFANSTDQTPADPKAQAEHDLRTKTEIRNGQPKVSDYRLVIKQQPETVEASEYEPNVTAKKNNNNNRKKSPHAVEPVPICELVVGDGLEQRTSPSLNCSPLFFVFASLIAAGFGAEEIAVFPNQLVGGNVASLFRCKKEKNPQEHGYFIFQDLRVKFPGTYRIAFTLCELVEDFNGTQYVLPCAYVASNEFTVFPKGRALPPPQQLSQIMKQVEEAGAKLRYRKAQAKKSKPDDNWGSTLDSIMPGAVRQRRPGKRSPKSASSGDQEPKAVIEGVRRLPEPNHGIYPGDSGMSQAGLFHSPTQYDAMHDRTRPGMYNAAEATGHLPTSYTLPQAQFTYAHPHVPQMDMAHPLYGSSSYGSTPHHYQGTQYGNGMQTQQHPMMQNVTGYRPDVSYQAPLIPDSHISGPHMPGSHMTGSHMPVSQMPVPHIADQREFANGQFSGITQYGNSNIEYDAEGRPVNGRPEYDEYPEDDGFQQQRQFYQG